MTETDLLEFLQDMHVLGAEDEHNLIQRLGQVTFERLICQGYMCNIPTPIGKVLILDSKGRRKLGLAAYYKSPPEAATSQWLQRRVKNRLEQQGWIFLEKRARHQLIFWDDRGQKVYVLARYRGYTAQSLRHILDQLHPLLIAEQSQLAVVTQNVQSLASLLKNYPTQLRLLSYLNY